MAKPPKRPSAMSSQEPSDDEYFSRVYLLPVEPQDDSPRFRIRIAAFVTDSIARDNKQTNDIRSLAATILRHDIGIEVPFAEPDRYAPGFDFEKFFLNAPIADVLDGITALNTTIKNFHQTKLAREWREKVQTVIDEEHLSYRVNEQGGVRRRVDEEFERSHAALIAVLGLPRYKAVAADAERAYDRLSERPAAATEAIKAMFAAVETLTKLIAKPKRVTRLNADSVEKGLKPLVEKAYRDDASECAAAVALLGGLKAWVKAGHEYRHGQRREAPREAPIEFAVAMLSSGASYLRWLAEIDRRRGE